MRKHLRCEKSLVNLKVSGAFRMFFDVLGGLDGARRVIIRLNDLNSMYLGHYINLNDIYAGYKAHPKRCGRSS